MNKKLHFYLLFLFFCFAQNFKSQTFQLTGNPVNTTGWDVVPSATVNTDFIQLTADQISQVGGIKLNAPINLKYCDKWRVEFDFRIDGNGTTSYGKGDGLAFWYLANPPASYTVGGGLGIPANATGLMVGFDIFNNATEAQMSKVHVLYGTNNGTGSNIEYNNTPGSTYHTADLISTQPFVGPNFKHVEVTGEVDSNNLSNWIIKIKIDNVLVVNQTFAPSGAAVGMTQGYFGFSASTGAASARHSIKNVKVFTDKVSILNSSITQSVCPNPSTGFGTINLTALNSQFVANPSGYTFTYSVGGTVISNPTSYQFNSNTTVNVIIKDNSALLCDNPDGTIKLTLGNFSANNVTIAECNNNGATTAVFNLTSAYVSAVPGITKKYFRTLADLNAGTNEITNPSAFISAPGKVYVKVTTPEGCTGNAEVTLTFHPLPVAQDAMLESCFIEGQTSWGMFNLTAANITTETGITKKFYTSFDNAMNGINEISTPIAYISPNADVYVKVTAVSNCFVIKKIKLTVTQPVKSSVLKDKIICIDARTSLDAGPGFSEYLWSTGATTQSIQGISAGAYWVRLKTGNCYTYQTVNVKIAVNPVISNIDIKNNTATVNILGGTAPYKFSLNGINWQDSNVFTDLPRGENTFYVKDIYNCAPIHVQITIPNLVNVITPNGDNVNDVIDYTALAYKKNLTFTVFDRYGNMKYEADKIRNYKWDGTSGGKKLTTGTYWYTISWNENDKNSTPTVYNGWVLLKNRE
ncbi:T9SS type B sorting domain-containing protein [Chryseobacterium oryzae]|uniref:T9SS type B sorting domain-containing protein n=1 Tax=Chryseobacterium oryzae TaxID=2929799 RepID=A0ABY4BI30_9FLAO|nr:T9SS type B sorting domain-containing protein [Chryseobacterium oryzae]UOE37907.1 T9SS type B sorting domain-containing protein [Chryseobacterium oryzae]